MKQKLLLLMVMTFCFCFSVFAQNKTVAGKVTDSEGQPLPGVTVRPVGASGGVSTGSDGRFSISVPEQVQSLSFSILGYASQNKAIGSGNLNVVLAGETSTLNEVVVSGAGLTARKKELGAAQTTLKNDALTQAKPSNIVSGLTGKVAGLTIQGVGSGVNPNYRIILRGMRSLTGNNQALIVIDNVIVPSSVLSNLNPDDVEDMTVLNGSSSAALYGSAASNGALIIKTKKGARDGFEINVANTTTIEKVAFQPGLQKDFGSGSANDVQVYTSYENQQYGPRFDGVVRPIGRVFPDGTFQQVPYSWTGSKNDFWETGIANMTDFSASSGNEKSTVRFSGQYYKQEGTTPGDKFNRATVKLAGTREISSQVSINYSAFYAQNRANLTTQTSNIYNYLLNAPGQAPLTSYKDWRNDRYANPNGYFNAYYNNPYFMADNYRQNQRNDYFIGTTELKYRPLEWLDFTGRIGLTSQNYSAKTFSDIFRFTPFTKSQAGSTEYKQTDILGAVADNSGYRTDIVSDFIAHAGKKFTDFKIDFTALGQLIQNQTKDLNGSITGLVVPGVFNLSNSTNPPTSTENNTLQRTYGLTGKIDLAFKDYLFLTLTGRNDWVSILSPDNRSFFYPGAQLSFVPTDAIPFLKNIKQIDFFKVRAGFSKVGQVNLGPYSLAPTFSQGAGYPYNGAGGLTLGNTVISPDLKPEINTGYEVGFDASFLKNRINTTFTYYNNKTKNQTVATGVSSSTGYFSYLTNVGQTSSKGIETSLTLVPYRNQDWEVTLGGNFSFYDNTVDYLQDNVGTLSLATYGGSTGSYAEVGQQFPVVKGTQHKRDDQGRIIVDPVTGYPSATEGINVLGRANAKNVLGLTLNVTYKGFTLFGSGEYRTGNVIYNSGGTTFDFSGAGINTVAYDRERFVIPNSSYWDASTNSYVENTNVSVYDGGAGYWTIAGPRTGIDENYITSAAFWKIRELALSYNIPAKVLASTKIIKRAKIGIQGRNLFIFLPKTNVYTDPEYSDGNNANNGNAIGLTGLSQTPPSRYFGATLSLTL